MAASFALSCGGPVRVVAVATGVEESESDDPAPGKDGPHGWSCELERARFEVYAVHPQWSDCSDKVADLATVPRALQLRPDGAPPSRMVPAYYFENCWLTLYDDPSRQDCEAHIQCYTEFGWVPHMRYYVVERNITIDLRDPDAPIEYVQQFTWAGPDSAELCTVSTEILLTLHP